MNVEHVVRADEEIRFRVSGEDKVLIVKAAGLEGVSVSEFLRNPAVDRARLVVAEAALRHATVIPVDEFDKLMAALDAPIDPARFNRARQVLRELDLDPT
ncbi:MAG: DUF1778 domain-containing protein [Actinomycetia bacterium]|nr:DUF1778 domain-containing protein [Actinomycetes bacterium]